MTKVEEGPLRRRGGTSPASSATPDASVRDERSTTPQTPQQHSSILDSTYRFFALYLTTLFSLDAYSAAANSPHRMLLGAVPPRPSPLQRPYGDFGEGNGVDLRLDPGGPQARRGGLSQAPAGINIPTCGSCTTPSIS
jgi:hypothetical protein